MSRVTDTRTSLEEIQLYAVANVTAAIENDKLHRMLFNELQLNSGSRRIFKRDRLSENTRNLLVLSTD